jgi:Kef-type K+ transport system membrane component KefB
MIVALFFLLAFYAFMHAARSFSDAQEPARGGALAFGFLLLAAFFTGRLFARFGLPRLTGYIVAGVIAGPSVLALLTDDMVHVLAPVKGVAVCLIALSAGGELNFARTRPLLRSIVAITLWTVVLASVACAATCVLLGSMLPFFDGLSSRQVIAASAVLGVAISAMSPAVVMALFGELEPQGPVSRTILGVVVVADLAVIVLFALTSSLAQAFMGDGVHVGAAALHVAWEIFGSIAAGAVVGVVLAVYLHKVQTGRSLFVLLQCVLVSEVFGRLALDPLIVMLTAGLFIENVAELKASELVHDIEAASMPVYIVFFGLAGAMLKLDMLTGVAVPAVALVAVRAFAMWFGARRGALSAGAEPAVVRWAFAGLLPQAGLALALALLLPRVFPGFGVEASALVVGVVALNELLMPVLLRYALLRTGEARAAAGPAEVASVPVAPAEPAN